MCEKVLKMRRLSLFIVAVIVAAVALSVLGQRAAVTEAQDATSTPTTVPTPTMIPATPTPAVPLSDGVNLTIYNVGTALVQDRRTFTLKRGVSMLDFTDVASSIDSTSVSFTPRAAAMLPMPDVMHAAMACSRNSTGVGA